MSDFPIALHGERITAVVIGGGAVGTRKARALVDAGVSVRVISPVVTADLAEAERLRQVTIVRESYRAEHLDRATVVIAATDSREVNAQIAVDAHARGKLVN
ncbi:MAG: bifunctional precorrin-2 dehydrogenase/sirohydrochlorin ferrochelatase, partial [Gemmatimonadaceae bacterium]